MYSREKLHVSEPLLLLLSYVWVLDFKLEIYTLKLVSSGINYFFKAVKGHLSSLSACLFL